MLQVQETSTVMLHRSSCACILQSDYPQVFMICCRRFMRLIRSA